MLCIKQAAPCSDSCECSSSVRLNIWQGSDLGWLSSDLIQHYPVQLTTAGLRVLKSQCGLTKYRIKAASLSLPENTHALSSGGTTSRITRSVFSLSLCQYSKHSLVATKKVIPNCPGEMAQKLQRYWIFSTVLYSVLQIPDSMGCQLVYTNWTQWSGWDMETKASSDLYRMSLTINNDVWKYLTYRTISSSASQT